MIHELIVTPEESPEKLRKRARKLAMTGGYEVVLADDLNSSQLNQLREMFQPDLERYQSNSAAYKSSLAGRIISAVEELLSD